MPTLNEVVPSSLVSSDVGGTLLVYCTTDAVLRDLEEMLSHGVILLSLLTLTRLSVDTGFPIWLGALEMRVGGHAIHLSHARTHVRLSIVTCLSAMELLVALLTIGSLPTDLKGW
jgi:hypothetical protein